MSVVHCPLGSMTSPTMILHCICSNEFPPNGDFIPIRQLLVSPNVSVPLLLYWQPFLWLSSFRAGETRQYCFSSGNLYSSIAASDNMRTAPQGGVFQVIVSLTPSSSKTQVCDILSSSFTFKFCEAAKGNGNSPPCLGVWWFPWSTTLRVVCLDWHRFGFFST